MVMVTAMESCSSIKVEYGVQLGRLRSDCKEPYKALEDMDL